MDQYQRLEQMHHTAWTAKDGLIGKPAALAQTTDGYLWIGTSNGLYRFDGLTFERYQPQTGSLPAAAVQTLLAVPDGGLWVGYFNGGVTFLAAGGGVVNYSIDDGLPFGTIRSFARDPGGVMWVAAVGGLARLEAGRWRMVRMDWQYPCRSAWRLFVDRDGTLWVGAASPDKVFYLPRGTRSFIDFGLDARVSAFANLKDTLVIGNWQTREVRQVRRAADGSISWGPIITKEPHLQFIVDPDGAVWTGTYGVVRVRVDRPGNGGGPSVEERFTRGQGLSGGLVRDLLVDRERNVWMLTEGGLDRFRRRNLEWSPRPNLENGGSLVVDKNREVWLATRTTETPALRRAEDDTPVANAPQTLQTGFTDPDGSIWFSKDGTFLHWVDGRFVQIPPPEEVVARGYRFTVMAAAWDRSGRLWASINGLGAFYRNDDRWTFVPVLPDRPDWTATAIHADADDRVWFAYRNELAMVQRDKVHVFTRADGLELGPLLAVTSKDQTVWVAGESGVAFLRGNRFHTVRTAPDAELGAVADIVPTADGLWLSAAAGIVHIREAELRRLLDDPRAPAQYERFDLVSDLPDALMSRDRIVSAAEGRDGVLWFVTNRGLVKLDPRQVVRNALPPPLVVRELRADDKTYSTQGVASLPPLTRTLRIDYTALSLTIPERVQFRYKLDGWETTWHDAGTRRTVFYTDLKPGAYTFRVLASNNDGVWNETGATLRFTVAPAWYQTIWFQALVVAGVAAFVVILYRMRVRRVSAALAVRFDERLAERTRIARELHDTLLQTVQASKLIAADALDRSDDRESLRRTMERLSEWLDRAVTEGRAALHSLRASAAEMNDLAESFRRAAESPTKPPALAVSVVVRGVSRDLHPIVRDEIYRIGYEAIRNAYAHSQATRLEIEIAYAQDLALRITDNGIGIDHVMAGSGKQGRFGLPGMRERAANIGAALSIVNAAPGTTITLVVPARVAFRTGPASPSH